MDEFLGGGRIEESLHYQGGRMKNLISFIAVFCTVLLAGSSFAKDPETAIVYDLVLADGTHVLTAAKPGKPVNFQVNGGTKYTLIGQRLSEQTSGPLIHLSLDLAEKDSANLVQAREANAVPGLRLSLSAPGSSDLVPLVDVIVEELPIEKVREKLGGGRAQCLTAKKSSLIIPSANEVAASSAVSADCCVRCDNITVCGCAVEMDCGSCCIRGCC